MTGTRAKRRLKKRVKKIVAELAPMSHRDQVIQLIIDTMTGRTCIKTANVYEQAKVHQASEEEADEGLERPSASRTTEG
jgi:hypothetical protein